MVYFAYCCQYLAPGDPSRVRVPRSTARVKALVSWIGYGIGRSRPVATGVGGAGAFVAAADGTGAAGAELQVGRDCAVARAIANADATPWKLEFTGEN